MKLKNRILSLLLVFCMVATLLPVSALAAERDRVQVSESTNFNSVQSAQTQALAPEAEKLESPAAGLAEALEANQPVQAEPVTVTAKEVENPGVDLKLQQSQETVEQVPYDDAESVRVIVVLEDKSLLDHGFTTTQIAANGTGVARQMETLVRRQETVIQSIEKIVDEPVQVKYRYNVAVSGLALEVPYGTLEEIRQLPGVKSAFVAPQYDLPEDMTDPAAEPNMYATKDTVGSAMTWENLGYTGQGMRIAIIDTGLDLDHPSFAVAPQLTEDSLTQEEIASVLESLNAYDLYLSKSAVKLTADVLYRSEKVPYGFNYVDRSLDVTHDNDYAGDHGTHVAGIAAANATEGTDVVGVAPDAQILVMKVFGVNGGAYFDDIMAALEDCYRLNVDAVNMSLGSPAGFTDEGETINEIYDKILDSDMIASISAGNSGSAASGNNFGTDRNLTQDPDSGMVSSPASYVGATVVASQENVSLMCNYLTVDGEEIPFSDVAAYPFTDLAGETLTYVMVPGYGSQEDYEGLDVAGKVAVISRGELAFTDKQQYAYDAGAIACVVYDNVEGSTISMQDAGLLPNVFVSKAAGELLADKAVNGQGTLTVQPADDMIVTSSALAGQMSDFSSWGVTPDLQLVPDITAPGGNIYSTRDSGTYGTMSGTSMSAPHITGMSALVLQYLRDKYDLTDAQAHTVAEALLMSTAEPMAEPSGTLYSPRKQGAGTANVYQAITSPAYLTVQGDTPKVSFGDDDDRTGVYRFSFEIHNLTDEVQTYALDGSAMTDQVDLAYADYGYYFMGETSRNLEAAVTFDTKTGDLPIQYDYNGDGVTDLADVQALLDAVNGLSDVKNGYDLNNDGKTNTADVQKLYELVQDGFTALDVVEVPASGAATVYVTVALSGNDKAYMDAYYENGIYVDGFIRLYAQGGNTVDLGLPFMGFYGDWSDARIFDSGWYYEDYPEFNRYLNVIFTDFGSSNSGLGLNPYLYEEYDPAHNVLSVNGDGYLDKVSEIYLSMMRNAREVDFTWTNETTGETLFDTAAYLVRKSYYYSAYGICIPMIVSDQCELYGFDDDLPDGTELKLTVQTYLDDGDNVADDGLTVPVYIDNEAPVLYTDEIAYLYNPYADTRRLEFYVSDNRGIAAVIPLTDAGTPFEAIAVEDAPGEKILISLDVTDYDSSFLLAVCDYGCNETYYEISFSGENDVDFDAFYGYRRYSVIPNGSYLYATDGLNGWYSFEIADSMLQHTSQYGSGQTAVAAAEYLDGYILGVDVNGVIFAMKAGDWSRTELGTLALDGTAYPALDMAFDYTTNTLFALTDELNAGDGGHLVKVNYLTGDVIDVGVITGIDSDSAQGVTLAFDNEGVLYTIDYGTGALYTVNKTTAKAAYVGETGYQPYNQQSMTVDHETDKLYWSAYQGYTGDSNFYEVNKATGELTFLADVEYNGAMVGLFKPWQPESGLFPQDTELTGLKLSRDVLMMCVGRTEKLTCKPLPYYAKLGEVTWTTNDETVATVAGGIVTAVGEGQAVITAAVGEMTISCNVTVSEFSSEMRLYDMYNSGMWMSLNAAAPESALILEDSLSSLQGFTAAAYHNGWIYAGDYGGGFYRLNPDTLQGSKIGNSGATLIAMSMNYNDGFLYGMEMVQSYYETWNYLVRVNPVNGEVLRLCELDMNTYGYAFGNMAIDHDGNFYIISIDITNYKTMLVKFRLVNDEVTGIETASLADWPTYNYGSMVYSGANNGIFWANDAGQLLWLDGSDMGNVKVMLLGDIAGMEYGATNMGLLEIPDEEPSVPYVAPSSVNLADSYLLLAGGTISVGLSVEPWNAQADAAYSVKDPTIAMVDEYGMLTGVAPGETTLGVYVEALQETLEANITVTPSTGSLYGFLLSDYMYSSDIWIRVPDTDPGSAETVSSGESAFSVYSGAYYNGTIYAYGKGGSSYNYKNYTLKINPADYSIEVQKLCNYTLRDMEFDYTTGTMYAIASGGTVCGALAQVDIETGDVVLVADSGIYLVAMTIDDQGRVYVIGEDSFLYQLDKTTAEPTRIGVTGAKMSGMYQSMHYDPNTGNTYWAQAADSVTDGLRLVNLNTGATTDLGLVGPTGAQMTAIFTVPEDAPTTPETVDPSGVQLDERNTVAVGKTVTLSSVVLPFSTAQVDRTLTWTTSNASIATVDGGVVTGVAAGTVTITATTSNGLSASCEVFVTETERRFYAYDETNAQWISFSGEDPAATIVERKDAEGETPISASAYTSETLYSYDAEGRFYTVDTETFERTKVGDALYGKTLMVEYTDRRGNTQMAECQYKPVDLSYDAAAGKLYAAVEAYNEDVWVWVSIIGEVDVNTGEIDVLIQRQGYKPGNLLVLDGRAFFVDTFYTGVLNYVDLYVENPTILQQSLVQGYWGNFDDGRSLIRDEYTGTVYTIRDLRGGESVLYTLNLGDASIGAMGTISNGIVANSLFIR